VVVVSMAVLASSCTRDRGADAPPGDVALVVPEIDAAAPTIRPPQRTDYLEVPPALPPTGSAYASSDDLDGIDTEECRTFLLAIRKCIPDSSFKEVLKNFKLAHKEASSRDAMRETCKRMNDSYLQSGGLGNCGQ
jgi:hypothetical protein